MDGTILESVFATLPGAIIAGVGVSFCALGFKLVRFYSLAFGVGILAALGCVLGALTGWPALALAFCLAGGVLGYALGPVFSFLYPTVAAALGGVALGKLLVAFLVFNHPELIPIALGAGFALVAALNVRLVTILWTSVVGASIGTLGILATDVVGPTLEQTTVNVVIVFAAFAVGGIVFQVQTTGEAAMTTRIARPVPKPEPAATTSP